LLLRGDSPSLGEALRSLAEVRPSSLPISVEFLADLLPSPAKFDSVVMQIVDVEHIGFERV
jgi:hypothetical protein